MIKICVRVTLARKSSTPELPIRPDIPKLTTLERAHTAGRLTAAASVAGDWKASPPEDRDMTHIAACFAHPAFGE